MVYFPVDLHTHSTASDGKLSPVALVQFAAQQGLRALALTDHDTVDGLDEALQASQSAGITVVPGVEFSTRHEYSKQFIGIHILGYFIDHHHPRLQGVMKQVQSARLEQKVRQIEKLQSFGFDIPVEAVLNTVQGVPGRPHIAAVLMARNPGRFESVQAVFDEYLGVGKKAHVGRSFALTVAEAAELIMETGGLPVLAHPGVYSEVTDTAELVKNAVSAGIRGLEVYYPYAESRGGGKLVAHFEALARQHKLVMTGGTDFHGRPQDRAGLGMVGLSWIDFEHVQEASNNN